MTIYSFIPLFLLLITIVIHIFRGKHVAKIQSTLPTMGTGIDEKPIYTLKRFDWIYILIGSISIGIFTYIIGRALPITLWTFEGLMGLIGASIVAFFIMFRIFFETYPCDASIA